jgi:hypothetical protein
MMLGFPGALPNVVAVVLDVLDGHHVDKGGPMEAVIVVCDRVDGWPAAESIRFKLGSRSLQLDLCDRHPPGTRSGCPSGEAGVDSDR